MDREELVRIRDRMASRGPDGEGAWYSSDGRVGLGHRRLSIIDLSRRAAQPLILYDDRSTCSAECRNVPKYVVSYNGEIYNYKAIRRELEEDGETFRSDSDTEVLLRLYAKKGERMVRDLRGMFAFALWDESRHGMFLARDPYGIKPLYYADDGRTLRAASQAKALLAGGRISQVRDPAGVAGFFLFGSVPEPWTLFEEIHALPAGATMWIDERGIRSPRTYFSIPATFREAAERGGGAGESDVQELIRSALRDSVKEHLVADVPVGAFLSSGIDSGAIVGIMTDLAREDIRTVTLGFGEFRGTSEDETPLARKTAELYGTKHATRTVTAQNFRDSLPRLLADMDQPSIDGINTWFVSRAAAETGLKVAVSGLGGDELFGGYPSFADIPTWVRYFNLPSRIPGLGEGFRLLHQSFFSRTGQGGGNGKRFSKNEIPKTNSETDSGKHESGNRSFQFYFSPKAAGFLKFAGDYAGGYLLRRGVFMPWELPSLMGPDAAAEGLSRLDPLGHVRNCIAPDPGTPFGRVSSLESSLYMRNQLLRDADWAGMAHGLEIRLPMVDSFLLKKMALILVAGLGETNKKRFLSSAPARPLPREVANRSKTGFVVPVGQWIMRNPELDSWREMPILKQNGCHWSRRWAYTVAKLGGN